MEMEKPLDLDLQRKKNPNQFLGVVQGRDVESLVLVLVLVLVRGLVHARVESEAESLVLDAPHDLLILEIDDVLVVEVVDVVVNQVTKVKIADLLVFLVVLNFVILVLAGLETLANFRMILDEVIQEKDLEVDLLPV